MSTTVMTRNEHAASPEAVRAALDLQRSNRELLLDITNLLYLEAWLLDNDRLEDWLGLLAEDIRYVAPVRRKVSREDLDLASLDSDKVQACHFNDNKTALGFRVARTRTGFDHYNNPTALFRRVISNVRLLSYNPESGDVSVTSNFMLFRAREEKEETFLVGARDDMWRRVNNEWRLARRIGTCQRL